MKFDFKRFFLITFGVIILGSGLHFFLFPSNLAVGGVSGFSIVLNNFIPSLSVGTIMFVVNIILFIAAFIFIGREFLGYTIYSSFALSGIIYLYEKIAPMEKPIVDSLGLNLLYGIIIGAVGMAIIFNQNSSTGGTDIIAKIINKYTNINIGISLILADFIVTLLAGLAFGIELGMYALLGVFINSFVIDNVIAGFNKKINMVIISREAEKINSFILKEIDRGTTLYYAEGGHTRDKKLIINTIVENKEYIKIKNYVKGIDNKAFIFLNVVNEVVGEGFIEEISQKEQRNKKVKKSEA